MLTRDGSAPTSLNSWLVAGIAGLAASAVALYSSTTFIGKSFVPSPLKIDVNRWNWLSDIHLNFDRASLPGLLPMEASVNKAGLNTAPTVRSESVSGQTASVVTHHDKKIVLRKAKTARVKKLASILEPIEFSARAEIKRADATNLALASRNPEVDGIQKMQSLHLLLRRNFILAVTHDFEPSRVQMFASAAQDAGNLPVTTQVRVNSHKAKGPSTRQQAETKPSQGLRTKAKRAEAVVARTALISKKRQLLVESSVKELGRLSSAEYSAGQMSSTSHSFDRVENSALDQKIAEASQKVDELVRIEREFLRTNQISGLLTAMSSIDTPSEAPVDSASKMKTLSAGSNLFEGVSRKLGNAASKAQFDSHSGAIVAKNEYSVRPDYSIRSDYSRASDRSSDNNVKDPMVHTGGYSALQTHEVGKAKSQQFQEAFDWTRSVEGVRSQVVTVEGDGAGWQIYSAPDYWRILARTSSSSVPFLSANSAQLLAIASGAKIENEAGIVFGIVPAGWTVSFSGRSERGVFLDKDNQAVSAAAVERQRYFAFVNAAPGAQLLELRGHAVTDHGRVAIPVVPGTATFVDLTDLAMSSVSGYVLDGSDSESRVMPGIQVRLSGSSGEDVLTASDGSFEIPDVLTVADFPIYLETDSVNGFTHRYEVSPRNLQERYLFRMGEEQIKSWIDQLEGGVSPDSGLLVAAVPPDVMQANRGKNLIAQVSPLSAAPNLIPETYSLTREGQLQIEKPLEADLPRFMSVQLPEGPLTAEVLDADQNIVWSRLLIAQPRIINIIGP